MIKVFKHAQQLANLALPQQDLSTLAFCKSRKPAKVSQWVSELHSIQVTQTGILLYQAIPQILRLNTTPATRFEMLESIRPTIQYVIIGLSKQFLRQNLSRPENAQKTAIIALALQKNIIDGYTICAKELIAIKKMKSAHIDLLRTSIHRAITGIGWLMLRNLQIYTQVNKNVWPQLYALFGVAEFYELCNTPVHDPNHLADVPARINDAFAKVLMMSASKLNQVSQNDVFVLFKHLDPWVRFITIRHEVSEDSTNKLLANVSAGHAPCLQDRFQGDPQDDVIELDCRSLVNHLNDASNNTSSSASSNAGGLAATSGGRVILPREFPLPLLCHILDSWSYSAQRSNARRAAKHRAEISVGIIDCHAEISGGYSFDAFLKVNDDSLGGISELGDFTNMLALSENTASNVKQEPCIHTLTVQNISPDGYCLLLQNKQFCQLEAGELLAIREEGRRTWSLGVARWIRKLKQGCQLGVQLLSTQPQPYAAAIRMPSGEYSDYMRAFFLPSKAGDKQNASVVTASVPFQAGAPVKLKQDDNEIAATLNNAILTTSKVTQFGFTTLRTAENDDTL